MGSKIVMMKMMMMMVLDLTLLAGAAFPFESGRYLEEVENTSKPSTQTENTVRIDPLDDFNKYRGGYDITNKHYWSSTAFTGVYGYAIAILWLLCGLGYGGYLLATKFCCQNRRRLKKISPSHNQSFPLPILLATFFTILAIIATGLVLGWNSKFHSRAKTIVDIIIDTADEASDTIYNTTGAMKEMSNNIGSTNGSGEASDFLISTSQRLDSQSADIERQARKNRRAIDKGLKIVYIITTVILSLNLIAAISLSAFGILKRKRALHLLIVVCWILTVLCWLFFGIYFFLDKFAGDTCTALEGFREDPYNNSLSSILPCDELLSAKSVLHDVSAGVFNMVNQVNRNISTSYGNIVQICNPFSGPPEYEYSADNCPANTIRIGDIPQVLRMLACPDSEGNCNGGILISSSEFNTVVAYTTSIQSLLNVFPGMDNLLECQTVRDAFSEILQKHCKPVKKYVRMEWAAMVFLAVVMVALILTWTIKAHQEQSHHTSDSSVKPLSAAGDILESGTTKGFHNDSRNSSNV